MWHCRGFLKIYFILLYFYFFPGTFTKRGYVMQCLNIIYGIYLQYVSEYCDLFARSFLRRCPVRNCDFICKIIIFWRTWLKEISLQVIIFERGWRFPLLSPFLVRIFGIIHTPLSWCSALYPNTRHAAPRYSCNTLHRPSPDLLMDGEWNTLNISDDSGLCAVVNISRTGS